MSLAEIHRRSFCLASRCDSGSVSRRVQWLLPSIRLLTPLLVVILVLVTTPAQANLSTDAQLPEQISDDDWIRVTSKHFELISNHTPWETRELARKLELFRQASEYLTGVALPDTIRPVKVFITPDKEVHQYLMSGSAGLQATVGAFFETLPGNYAVSLATTRAPRMSRKNSLERWANPKPKRNKRIRAQTSLSNLLHEFTHYLAASDGTQIYPLWYSEGFAEYLSSMSFAKQGKVQFGLPLDYHLETVRRKTWIPSARILATSHFENQQRKYIQSFYAQSWLMTSWFYAKPERRESLNNYLRALTDGQSWQDAWAEQVGIGLEELDRELKNYSRRRRFLSQAISMDHLTTPDEPLQSTLTNNELLVEIGHYFLDARQLTEPAEMLFEQVLGTEQNNLAALHGMSRALTDRDWQQAFSLASKALALDPEHVPSLTHAAELNRLRVMQQSDPREQHRYLDIAIEQVEQALEHDASDVEALYTAGRLYASKREFSKSDDAFARALEFAPGSVGLQEALISLYFFRGDADSAEQLVERVRRSNHMPASLLASFNDWVDSLREQHRSKSIRRN